MGRRSEGGRPPRPRGLERKRLPGAEGPPEGKDKDAMLRSSLAAGGGAVVVGNNNNRGGSCCCLAVHGVPPPKVVW